MPSKKRRISKRKIKNKKHRHVLFILLLIAIAVFFMRKEFSKDISLPEKPVERPPVQDILPQETVKAVPKIAIVIDDLGPSKKAADNLFAMNAPFTFSILPHETYSQWIADKAHSLGHDVIGHIPMEAIKPHQLGKGGLYTWMTDEEILETTLGRILFNQS